MSSFDKAQTIELKDYLSALNIHNGELKDVLYDGDKKLLRMIIVDPCADKKTDMIFGGVIDMFFVNGDGLGEYNHISSLTVEEACSGRRMSNEDVSDSLYLVLRCFSGDEFHVIANRVSFEAE